LVTDLFKRQADDPKLTRGEALRQAMMAGRRAGLRRRGRKNRIRLRAPIILGPLFDHRRRRRTLRTSAQLSEGLAVL